MAENSITGGQQRSFAKNISRQSALQIRQSATAAVKALTEQPYRPRLRVVDPLDYEGELSSRRRDLEKETYLNLLLFPQQDISVNAEEWHRRTEGSSVPSEAFRQMSNLFTAECLRFYTSQWHKVTYNYVRYSSSFSKALTSEYQKHLPREVFELDLIEEERLASLSSDYIDGGTPLSKRGYLYKGPFPSDGGISVSMKNYRKRWFCLTGGPNEGGYTLLLYKDEKSSNIKGKIALDTCTEIKTNPRYKQYGFDVMTEDDKVFYPLATDSDDETEEWISVLTRAIGLEVEETDRVPVSPMSSFYQQETLKDARKTEMRPELLEYTSSTDTTNAKNRERDRHHLFQVYPELMQSSVAMDDHKPQAPIPVEKFGLRFLVRCHQLRLRVTAERNGGMGHIEPFFLTLALFDAHKGLKISEDFHVDLNDPALREMLPPTSGSTDDGPHILSKHATTTKEAVFSVSFPHPEVYLVVRIEKVLQGGIGACAEPYIKTAENPKISQKLAQQMTSVCGRLGQYRMPFAWTARTLFTSMEELEQGAEFSPLYKQEREKLTDEEMLKILTEYKNLHKQKLQVIPGSLHIEVLPLQGNIKSALTPSLLPVKPPEGTGSEGVASLASPTATPPALEVQEFPPLEAYHPHTHYHPRLTFTHHLYIYPNLLKYDAQKAFAKARNIACCVQFKDSDDRGAEPLPVIYNKSPGDVLIDRANTAVLHHCTTPCFYEEVKLKLPVEMKSGHHLLFIFFHVSCDVQKATKSSKSSTKQPAVESIVGYAWLPLLESDGRIVGGSHGLPVATSLPPGYLSSSPGKQPPPGPKGTIPSEMKWVDGHKPVFRVSTRLDSTIYTQDPELNKFFSICENLDKRSASVEPNLQHSLKAMGELDLATTIHFLPVILTQLFRLLCHSSREVEQLKPDVLGLLLTLVDTVATADRTELLRSYIEFIFVTEVDSSRKRAVHDELARLLVQMLRQQDPQQIPKFLDHLWFFLEVMLKSMAQYLTITKKISASRKTRYPEDFGWNLQSFVTILLTHIRERHNDLAAKKANRSLADFVMRTFSFMDRGVVFKIVARYLEAFSVRENMQLSDLKLEFLRIVCEHEHFIALNLPFPTAPEHLEYSLNDEFCRKHFLIGVLLREVESSLEHEAGPIRKRTIRNLRNLLAKHDCDPRYNDAGQKARIAALYFPLIPLVLEHVTRLDTGSTPYVSPMLSATYLASFQPRAHTQHSVETMSLASVFPASAPGTLQSTPDKDKHGHSSLAEFTSYRSTQSRATGGTMSLPRIESEVSLDLPDTSLSGSTTLLAVASPTPTVDQTMLDMDKLGREETRDLLICVLFVLRHLDKGMLLHWWRECVGTTSAPRWSSYDSMFSTQLSQLLDFYDLLESCLYTFKYAGRRTIALKLSMQSTLPRESTDYTPHVAPPPPSKEKVSKKHASMSITSATASLMGKGKDKRSSTTPAVHPTASLPPTPLRFHPSSPEDIDVTAKSEGALANEVGLTILSLMETFANNFKRELCEEEGDNILMVKYFSLLVTFLQLNQSATMNTHAFAVLRSFIHRFPGTLFKGSPVYCGILCYEILHCINSRLPSTRTEATALLYLLMRCNFEHFKGRGFVRTHLQSTIAVSRIVSTLLGQTDSNLRRSLATIATYASQDEKVQGTPFPAEVRDLMKRLKTVLSATAQMKVHQNDPEKLVDLHYSLAKSYGNSPELRQTWLDSMAALHLKYGNYSEAAHCCIHIAGLVAEYLKLKGIYPPGCAAFRQVSPNIELEESSIKEDMETADEQRYTERNLVSLLESSINYLERSERYEIMSEIFKLLLPFYEKARDFKHMMGMYGKLHEATRKIVDVMTTGRRYLGTYFRIAFFGRPFGEDNEKQFVYKEPSVTTLAELTLRLQKLYSRKFGNSEIVHIIQESGKVNPSALDLDHAHIQITHVEPYFSSEQLQERQTKFERHNKISRFVFETPFTQDGRTHGDVTKQCMRKTILTTSHWFPYVKKRIQVIDQEQFELSPVEVAIEAIEKKTADMAGVVQLETPDIKKLQLLLQGSISTQVNQGVLEYAVFLREPQLSTQPRRHIEKLKEIYRSFMDVCQEALELNGRLISTDQLLYHDELKNKFQMAQASVSAVLRVEERSPRSSPSPTDTYPKSRRLASRVDPHRMSAILFHSISGSK